MTTNTKYNLEERTAIFGEDVIVLCKQFRHDDITKRLIPQLVASATSVGANYCEADCSESDKDFVHKMSIANKEAKESKHFLRMVLKAYEEPLCQKEIKRLYQEAFELNLIFTSIIKKTKEKL